MAEAVLCVCWEDHSCELASVYQSLLENNFLVDCTLCAEGQSLKAHRLVLSACSPYFHQLFREESGNRPFIIFLDAPFATLKAVIDFMYLGETRIPEGNLKAFLTLSQSLKIKGLGAFSKYNKKKNVSSNSAGNGSRGSFDDDQNTCGDKSIKASPKDNLENYSQPHRSQSYPEVEHSISSDPFERYSTSHENVLPPQEYRRPLECDDGLVDPEITVKQEPLFAAVPERNEILDNTESSEPMSETLTNKADRGTASIFGEQHLNQFSIPKRESLNEESEEPTNIPVVPGNHTNDTEEGTETACGADGLPPEEAFATQLWTQESQESTSLGMQSDLQMYSEEERLPSSLPHQPTTSSANLASHNRTSAGRSSYVCDICGAVFNWPSHLIIHRRKHTGERPYSCKLCGKTFTQKPSVVRHMRTHTGERPFSCDVCGKTFGQACHLAYHRINKHAGESPFQCDVCGKTFYDPLHLSRHRRSHTEGRP